MNPMSANPATIIMRAFERESESRAPRRARRRRMDPGKVVRTRRQPPADLG